VALEALTWTELRGLVQSGKTTIILPLGGTEQNGPHMALGKHNVRVRLLSERIARVLGDALVGPVLAYVPEGRLNPPEGHMRFPGTITVADDVFHKTLESAARSVRVHGFRHIVLLSDHGSTGPIAKSVAARLNREWAATPVRVHAVDEYYQAATAGFGRLLEQRGFRRDEIGQHAGLADTSLTLALAPTMVRSDGLRRKGGHEGEDGVTGDPGRASAELGELGVELIVRETVSAVRRSINPR
jgi:creatinine amidohydrolase